MSPHLHIRLTGGNIDGPFDDDVRNIQLRIKGDAGTQGAGVLELVRV